MRGRQWHCTACRLDVDNIDTRRSFLDVLEHIGSGGVFIGQDVMDRRPEDHHIVVNDLSNYRNGRSRSRPNNAGPSIRFTNGEPA